MLGPFEFLLLSSACCAVTRELTLGRRTWDSHDRTASLWAEARGVVHVNEAGIQGQGLALRVIAQEEWKQPLLENFRKTLLFQVRFPKYCSSINQAGALSVPFSHFQREMVCWRVIPQPGFISFSCWDVLARSSPLVYWLQTICDCRGLWLLSLQKQEMQSIHERHRTFFFLLKNVYLFLLGFLGTRT